MVYPDDILRFAVAVDSVLYLKTFLYNIDIILFRIPFIAFITFIAFIAYSIHSISRLN